MEEGALRMMSHGQEGQCHRLLEEGLGLQAGRHESEIPLRSPHVGLSVVQSVAQLRYPLGPELTWDPFSQGCPEPPLKTFPVEVSGAL